MCRKECKIMTQDSWLKFRYNFFKKILPELSGVFAAALADVLFTEEPTGTLAA